MIISLRLLLTQLVKKNLTRNSAIADKPRDAFVQMQWCGWPKTRPSPYVSPCRIWSLCVEGCRHQREMMNCGECDLVGDPVFSQAGAPQTHQSVLEISRSTGMSAICWSHHSWSFQSHSYPEEKSAYSVASVFLASVATQLTSDGKLFMHLGARNIGILYAKNYSNRFKLL